MKRVKRGLYLILFFGLTIVISSQTTRFNLIAGAGPLVFIGTQRADYFIGSSRNIGVNLLIAKKRQAFIFKPALLLINNGYNTAASIYETHTRVEQKLICLSTEAMMKISKRQYLKAGLFAGLLRRTQVDVVYSTTGSSYYAYSNNDLYKHYVPTEFQAGVSIGWYLPITTNKRDFAIDFTIWQYGTPPVSKNFMNPDPLGSTTKPVMSVNHRPTVFFINFEMALRKKKKEKEEA
ncbi:MAG: hypothetical protein IT236_10105 [Bacteroidia bacterium]|nr:hypothetical protein [Bacteroidia bacterium]